MGGGSARRFGGALGVIAALAALGGCGATALAHHQQIDALYVIDHSGASPPADGALAPYARAFQFVLARCKTDPDDLTNLVIAIADQASTNGGHSVSNLQTLQAMGTLITWPPSRPHGCGFVDDVAESQLENHA